MGGVLRFAPHTGYLPHDRTPLFNVSAGPDPVDHVRFAAAHGMAGIMDPWAVDRPPEQLQRIQVALEETGLVGGCICMTPLERFTQPLWVAESEPQELKEHLHHALQVAGSLGSTVLAVLLLEEQGTAPAVQRRRAVDRLRRAADAASARGVTLAIEPIGGFPGMLLGSFAEAVELVREARHPGVKLIFDTGHVTTLGEPVLESYVEAFDDIAVLQLADMPERVEPGAGAIDFVPILAHAMARGYDGLVELEHQWSVPGKEAEERGLEALRTIEAQARALLARSRSVS